MRFPGARLLPFSRFFLLILFFRKKSETLKPIDIKGKEGKAENVKNQGVKQVKSGFHNRFHFWFHNFTSVNRDAFVKPPKSPKNGSGSRVSLLKQKSETAQRAEAHGI